MDHSASSSHNSFMVWPFYVMLVFVNVCILRQIYLKFNYLCCLCQFQASNAATALRTLISKFQRCHYLSRRRGSFFLTVLRTGRICLRSPPHKGPFPQGTNITHPLRRHFLLPVLAYLGRFSHLNFGHLLFNVPLPNLKFGL